MKTLIIRNWEIIDERTFHAILTLIQRMYIPYKLVYVGKRIQVTTDAGWEIHVSSSQPGFWVLVGLLSHLFEFWTKGNRNPKTPIACELLEVST